MSIFNQLLKSRLWLVVKFGLYFSLFTVKFVTSQDPGPRQEHCLVTYHNSVYLFGGVTDSLGQTFPSNFFHRATLPLNTNFIQWEKLDTTNVINVMDPACIVEQTLGYFLVIGGARNFANLTADINPGLQVYNFKTGQWNDPSLIQGFPKKLTSPTFRPRATVYMPKSVFLWGNIFTINGTIPFIYQIDMTTNPWTWNPINQKNKTITSSAGIASAKGNAWTFGGLDKDPQNGFNPSKDITIYNPNNELVIPPLQVPINISDAVVGILDGKFNIIILDDGDANDKKHIVEIVFDLGKMQIMDPRKSANGPINRRRAAATQIHGSDVVLIHGGTEGSLGQNTTDTMIAYNMTTGTWVTQVDVILPIQLNNFKLPLINGKDLNINFDDPSNAFDPQKPANISKGAFNTEVNKRKDLSNGAILAIIFSSILTLVMIGGGLRAKVLWSRRDQKEIKSLPDIVDDQRAVKSFVEETKHESVVGIAL
ncbi:hypothetical protein G9A89_007871 [Geosiphon pyriformis]|nr:hypothetical protein G9A89_007871 [Geosiphon pyriformis]